MREGVLIAGRFLIEKVAGVGGMGTVYRGKDSATGEPVAIKLMNEDDPSSAQRFAYEARILSDLGHPNIVRYITHGHAASGEPYLIMEWLDGESLHDRLARSRLTVDESVELAARAASALAAAHACGVAHREIKPNNLLLVNGSVEDVKLLDFGIAHMALATRRLTKTGKILGTPGYMAPEQVHGERGGVGPAADVFSLGAVLFECLTGKPAFEGTNLLALLAKVLLEDPPRARELCPEVPQAASDLVARMLSKDPTKRPKDGAEVARALGALRDSEGAVPSRRPANQEVITEKEAHLLCVVVAMPLALESPVEAGAPTVDAAASEERLREIRALAAAMGARVDELPNGAILLSIVGSSHPTAQAARAARCARCLRELMPDSVVALVTGRAEARERLPVGDVVSRAAALIDAELTAARAPAPGAATPVRVDEVTKVLLGERFLVETAPGGVVLLLGERDTGELSRSLLGKRTPFLGRDRELQMLQSLITDAIEERTARATLVTGAAGMGKSRLAHEIVEWLRRERPGTIIAMGRADSIGAGSAFSMIASAIRSGLQIATGDPIELGRQKIVAMVERYIEPHAQRRVAEFLGELMGIHFSDGDSPRLKAARQNAVIMADQIRDAYLDFTAAVARESPVVFVVEDLHWGDEPSIKLIDAALRTLRDLPYVVLALARPEVRELFPKLWASRDMSEVRLRELPRRAAEGLIRHALGEALPLTEIARLVDRAAGNVFYLEEIIRAVADGRAHTLPETVLGMVEAGLNTLDPESRRVLRAASVFGEAFWEEGVLALLGGEGGARRGRSFLSALIERELIVPQRESRLAGQREHAFRHALIREAAYAMLTERDRAAGHVKAGDWLLSVGEENSRILAEHFDRGGDHPRAAKFYAAAAQQALFGAALSAALALTEKGLALEAQGDTAAALRAIEAAVTSRSGDLARALAVSLDVLKAATPGGRSYCVALTTALSCALMSPETSMAVLPDLMQKVLTVEPERDATPALCGGLSSAIHVPLLAVRRADAELFLRRTEEICARYDGGDPSVSAWCAHIRATFVRYVERDPWATLTQNLAAMRDFDLAGDRFSALYLQVSVGLDYVELGAFEEAEEATRRGLSAMPEGNLASLFGRFVLSVVLISSGALDAGYAEARAVIEGARTQGERFIALYAGISVSEALLARGDLDAAASELASIEMAQAVPTLNVHALSLLAELRLAQREPLDALAVAEDVLARARATSTPYYRTHTRVLLARAEALRAASRPEEAREAIREARDDLLWRAAKIPDPGYKKSFLERVPAHARALALAREWLGSEGV